MRLKRRFLTLANRVLTALLTLLAVCACKSHKDVNGINNIVDDKTTPRPREIMAKYGPPSSMWKEKPVVDADTTTTDTVKTDTTKTDTAKTDTVKTDTTTADTAEADTVIVINGIKVPVKRKHETPPFMCLYGVPPTEYRGEKK